jgi:hypothetical protein
MSKKVKVSNESLIQAMKCTALLVIVQNEFDILDNTGFTFSDTMSQKAKSFLDEIDRALNVFCTQNGVISEEAYKQYTKLANKMTAAMNRSFQEEILKKAFHEPQTA